MRWLLPVVMAWSLAIPAAGQSRTQLVAAERQLRKALETTGDVDMDLDADRFETWRALAANLEKQGRIDAAIAAMYQGAGEIPTRSADFRATSRWAFAQAVAFEERLRGPSERTTRASWAKAVSIQRGRSPVDRAAADAEPFAQGYLGATIGRLSAIGRHDEAHALASGAMRIATSFRLRRADAGVQAREMRLYGERRVWLLTSIRTAYRYAGVFPAGLVAAQGDADGALRAGRLADAERQYRAILAAQPDPILVSAVRLHVTRGLVRALAVQGGAKLDEARQLHRAMLARMRLQLWQDDPLLAMLEREAPRATQ